MATSKITVQPPASRSTASAGREDDRALVDRCLQGDLGAFEELYRAHAGRLFSLTCRMVGNHSDAEDLLQEVFLAAHRKLDTFRGDSALGTWLYRLATNLCLDYLRSRATRSSQVTDSLDDEPWIADAGSRRLADQTVSKMDLERALAMLPEGSRAAFVLHDIEGLEHQEVAEVLGIAEGTSKSQVHKARMRLRALLSAPKARHAGAARGVGVPASDGEGGPGGAKPPGEDR
jgi:RNA polymerase sigma-70 factor (ECF subfamily)